MPHFTDGMTWLNEPPFWTLQDGDLVARSAPRTDFWQGTYYGFHRDDGHFLQRAQTGEFTAEASFTGAYEALYDQAGMMLRADATHWLKCGIELSDGALQLSVVVTNGHSDWSVQRLGRTTGPVGLRMTRLGDAIFVQFRVEGGVWTAARLAYFPPEPSELQVGLAFCSPERAGFEARFHGFEIGPPRSRAIHGD